MKNRYELLREIEEPMAYDLQYCLQYMEKRERERLRCKRFAFGDQWIDSVRVGDNVMSEEQYILSQGNMPLKNNLIRRILRNVLGVFRQSYEEHTFSHPALKKLSERNNLTELYARTMEEFLIGGLVVHRKWFGAGRQGRGCHTTYVSPGNFFIDPRSCDPLGEDADIVGEVHRVSFSELAATFAKSAADYDALAKLYPPEDEECMVTEIWRRERLPQVLTHHRDNATLGIHPYMKGDSRKLRSNQTWRMQEMWRYYFTTPGGRILAEGESPYLHGSHPYVWAAYPFIDGEVHSFVGDIIDQQKYTNRLITLYDWVIRASAKGVLLFPENALPEDADIQSVADAWSHHNSVIVYKQEQGTQAPHQVVNGTSPAGITDLLDIQLKMLEDVSGVSGALQGKLDNTSMSGTLYDTQTRNALTALRDIIDSFNSFIGRCEALDLSNLRQTGALLSEK